jgi:hypothetical protein
MFLLSIGTSGGFSDSDRTAIHAVTEAGLAAFEADIQSSAVALGPALLTDSRLKEAMEREGEVDEGMDLQGTLIMVANEGLLEEHPLMSVALVDKTGTIVAKTGLDEGAFDEVVKLGAFTTVQASTDSGLFSATIAGKLYAVKVSRPETGTLQRRLVAIQAVDLGGGSFLRRVLGTSNPAGLVRDGAVLGEPIGGASATDLTSVVTANMANAPPEGASQVFEIGEGADKRLGAIGRVPGPAGKGEHGTIFAVLSLNTEGATRKDLAQALSEAMNNGMGQVSWPLILGLLVISLALSFYLPHLEGAAPLKRLAGEFQGMAAGNQHQIFHDTYGGNVGAVARAAVQAQEALRMQWEAELAGDDLEGLEEDEPSGKVTAGRRTRSTRSTRGVKRSGRHRQHKSGKQEAVGAAGADGPPAAIELPDTPQDAVIEGNAAGSGGDVPPPAPGPAGPAPTFSDEVSDDDVASLLGDEPEPPPAAAPAPPPPAEAPALMPKEDEDPKEAYFHGIYDEFVETKNDCGEPTAGFTFEKFAKKLRKNTADLMKRPGVADVKFTVYVKDGKAALKAKVIKE